MLNEEYNQQIIYMIAEAKKAFVFKKNISQFCDDVYLFKYTIDNKLYRVFGLKKANQYKLNYNELRSCLLIELNCKENSPVIEVIGDSSMFDKIGSQFAKEHFAGEMKNFNGLLLYGYNGEIDLSKDLLDVNGLVNDYIDTNPEYAERVIANIVDYHTRIALVKKGQPVPTLVNETETGWGSSVSQHVCNFFLVWDICSDKQELWDQDGAKFGDDIFASDSLVNHKALLYGGGVQSFEQATNILMKEHKVVSVSGLRGQNIPQNIVKIEGIFDKKVIFFEAALFFNKIKALGNVDLNTIIAFKNSYVSEEEKFCITETRAVVFFDPFKLEVNQRRKKIWNMGWNNFIEHEIYRKIGNLDGALCSIDVCIDMKKILLIYSTPSGFNDELTDRSEHAFSEYGEILKFLSANYKAEFTMIAEYNEDDRGKIYSNFDGYMDMGVLGRKNGDGKDLTRLIKGKMFGMDEEKCFAQNKLMNHGPKLFRIKENDGILEDIFLSLEWGIAYEPAVHGKDISGYITSCESSKWNYLPFYNSFKENTIWFCKELAEKGILKPQFCIDKGYGYSEIISYEGYELALMSELDLQQLEKGKLYIKLESDIIKYKVLDGNNVEQSGAIITEDMPNIADFPKTNDLDQFAKIKKDILEVTSKRGHTPYEYTTKDLKKTIKYAWKAGCKFTHQ